MKDLAAQFIRFCIVGLTGLGLCLVLTFAGTEYLHIWYFWSFLVSTVITWTYIFFANSYITFGTSEPFSFTKYASFILGYASLFWVNAGIVYGLTSIVGVPYLVSIAIGTTAGAALTFAFSKIFIFGSERSGAIPVGTQQRFGYEWGKYHVMSDFYEVEFRNWTKPMQKDDWRGKRVLDAGCGMGRNSYYPLLWGAAHVTAFDYDERTVARAKQTLAQFSNAEVVYKSIYDIRWMNEYDIAISIGVIHHLADPQKAVARIADSLRSGGTLHLWVYSYEGNEWIVRFIDPIRKSITSRLPLPLVDALSYFLSVPLYVFVRLFAWNPYLRQLALSPFLVVHTTVFDQLIPQIAHYWRRDEVRALVDGLSLHGVTVERPDNGQGWILRATKS